MSFVTTSQSVRPGECMHCSEHGSSLPQCDQILNRFKLQSIQCVFTRERVAHSTATLFNYSKEVCKILLGKQKWARIVE